MGWAVTYCVKLGRPLNPTEEAALGEWSKKNFPLASARPEWLERWRGLLPEKQLAEMTESLSRSKARPHDCDFHGFIQTRSAARFRKVVRGLQQLEVLFPFADVRMSDDYYSHDSRPRDVDPDNLVPLADEPSADRSDSVRLIAPEDVDMDDTDSLDEVDEALARAKREFARFKDGSKG